MILGVLVGWFFTKLLSAVLAPGGNLGGDNYFDPPATFGMYQDASGNIVINLKPGQHFKLVEPTFTVLDVADNIGISIGGFPMVGNYFSFTTTGGGSIRGGSGAPAAGLGNNGDYFFRTDTPGTANQRVYVKSAGAWVGIL